MAFVKSCLVLACVGCCVAAPQPIEWDDVSRKIKEWGDKARDKLLPAAKGACTYLNNIPQQPSYQGYPQAYYPSAGRSFPQAPGFPSYNPPSSYFPQQYYPSVSSFPARPVYVRPTFTPFRPNFNTDFNRRPSIVPSGTPDDSVPNSEPVVPNVSSSNGGSVTPGTTIEQDDMNANEIPPFIPPTNDIDDEEEINNGVDDLSSNNFNTFNV